MKKKQAETERRVRRCPYCPFETSDIDEEIAHMRAEHPEIVEERMVKSGFRRDPETGEWVDTLASED